MGDRGDLVLNQKMWSQVEKVGAEKHPNRVDKKILYGTAGLRTKYNYNNTYYVPSTRL